MNKQAGWVDDGVGCGGQYLYTSNYYIYAGVHAVGDAADCSIWTPGCGFSPRQTSHTSVAEAKAYAEAQLKLLGVGTPDRAQQAAA